MIKRLIAWLRTWTLQNSYHLIVAVFAPLIAVQLYFQAQTHQLDQIIAWKNSTHELNALAMLYPSTFKDVLYPRSQNPEEVKKLTAAYASLHALEVMYYMRIGREYPPDRLDTFLRAYVEACELRTAWEKPGAQTAFTKKFQDKLSKVIEQDPKECSRGESAT